MGITWTKGSFVLICFFDLFVYSNYIWVLRTYKTHFTVSSYVLLFYTSHQMTCFSLILITHIYTRAVFFFNL